MSAKHSHQRQTLRADDTAGDTGRARLWRPRAPGYNGELLTRSPERPGVPAGTRCPRCSGSMFVERQLRADPELVCQSCGYNVPDVDLTALLELAVELEETTNRKPYRGKVPL